MKITEILSQEKPVLSFEVFPPKKESVYETVEQAAVEIARLSPSFMSVTYGAGGGTSQTWRPAWRKNTESRPWPI